MPNKTAGFITVVLSLALFGVLLSCAKNKELFRTEDSLPQSELARYNDSFDKMREDLWDKAEHLYRKEQVTNFKPVDMYLKDGKLIIQTRTEGFSKGGLVTKYRFRGDFDIQLDFLMDFTRDIAVEYMDQVFILSVFDNRQQMTKINAANIGLAIRWGTDQGQLFSNCFVNGKKKGGFADKILNFKGSFRIIRTGKFISTLHRTSGTADWTQKFTARVTDNDLWFGFQLRNFFFDRTTIRAKHTITVVVDRFKINAAQEIVEAKI